MNYQDIAVVVYNNLPETCKDIKENLCDLTRFKFGGQYNYKIFDTDNITTTLASLANEYKWAVVAAAGTTIREQAQIQHTVEYAIEQKSPMACHILDRQGYFHFHPQWFAIDLSVYREIDCPAFEEQQGNITLHTRKTERSPDNVHDDYTPWWLHSHPEPAQYTCNYQGFGTQVIAGLINAGYNIANIPPQVRERKNYCYPEHNAEGIRRIIDDPAFVPEDNRSPLFWFHHEVNEMTRSLSIGYYVLNTEPLNSANTLKVKQFDCFVGVASGVKPACIVGQDNFANDSYVVLFDISPAAIKWQQYLFAEWDGDFNKLEHVLNVFKQQNPDLRPIYYQHQSFDQIITWFFSLTNMNAEEFQRCWKKYQSMKVEFVNVNLLEDQTPVLAAINQASKGAYLWTSNLFNMDYLTFYKTNRWTKNKFEEFNKLLQSQTHVPVAFEDCNKMQYFNLV
jgi:hypothetical protein